MIYLNNEIHVIGASAQSGDEVKVRISKSELNGTKLQVYINGVVRVNIDAMYNRQLIVEDERV